MTNTTMPRALSNSLAALNACDASPAQRTYMLAKAAHGAAVERRDREKQLLTKPTKEEYTRLSTDEMMEHPYYLALNALDEKYRVFELSTILTKAEDVLVEWAREHSKAQFGERFARIAPAFDKWPLYGNLRKTLIDICFRMPSR